MNKSRTSTDDLSRAKEWFQAERRYAKKRAAILKLAEATRLTAATKLRQKAAQAVHEAWPANRDQLEQVLWPLLSRYAERVFDSIAEARLARLGNQSSAVKYVDWLTSRVIPAVVADVCTPIVGRFQVTVQHVLDVLGEGRWPEQIPETRRALWGMLTEVISGPYTENLDKRLTAHLNGRIDRWESEVIKKRSGLRQSKAAENSSVGGNEGGMEGGTGDRRLKTETIDKGRLLPEATHAGTDRRTQVDAFVLSCRRDTPVKVIKTHIWKAVKHTTPRQFQYWQAGQDRRHGENRGATPEDDRNFRRVLAMKPAAFVELLVELGIIQLEP